MAMAMEETCLKPSPMVLQAVMVGRARQERAMEVTVGQMAPMVEKDQDQDRVRAVVMEMVTVLGAVAAVTGMDRHRRESYSWHVTSVDDVS
jgi:hypothetical protein